MQIEFLQVTNLEQNQFIENLQKAFAVTIHQEFDKSKENLIPSSTAIVNSIQAKGAESFFILLDGKNIGGFIVNINKKTQHNFLDFFYINKGYEGQNIGQQVWQAIEKRYPQTKCWSTITPYFEKRNIHFYINKCKFKAVEFMHPQYKSPQRPIYSILKEELYFYFEKDMT